MSNECKFDLSVDSDEGSLHIVSLLKKISEAKKRIVTDGACCVICQDGRTMSHQELLNHYYTHEKELLNLYEDGARIYYCHMCEKPTAMEKECLREHYRLVHLQGVEETSVQLKDLGWKEGQFPVLGIHRCEICLVEFDSEINLNKHLHNHDNYYKCVSCNAGFKKLVDYSLHLKTHGLEELYSCPICVFKTKLAKNFKEHMILDNHIGRSYNLKQNKILKCSLCDKSFNLRRDLRTHMQRIHDMRCQTCKRFFASHNALRTHENKEHPCSVVCDTCGRSFSNKYRLIVHIRIHSGEKPYKCRYCGKGFLAMGAVKVHERTHTGAQPYKCEYCGKCFKYCSSKLIHIRTHTGEKPYKCEYCDKGFTQLGHMERHKRIHTGERPYKCEYCDKSFSLRSNMEIHKRIHTVEKPYKCEYCYKSFTQLDNMMFHKRIHKKERPYKCQYCDKSFSLRSNMVVHTRIHTGVKPYKCEYCDKSFTLLDTMVSHKRIHTGEKPYKCEQCNKSFRQRSSLISHKRLHPEKVS